MSSRNSQKSGSKHSYSGSKKSSKYDGDNHPLLKKLRLYSSLEDLKDLNFYAALLAECIGTSLLVFLGTASTLSSGNRMDISLAFGLAVATIVWAIAHISGGHINPAVSIGMWFCRRISLAKFLLYVVVQCFGAYLGAAFLSWVGEGKYGPIGVTKLRDGINGFQGGVIELFITAMLVFTVFATCDEFRNDLDGSGPLAIGLSVALGHFAFNPVTGPSMNPARSFGPALRYNFWTNQTLYWMGPLLGGLIAAILYEFFFAQGASLQRFTDWLCAEDYERKDVEHQLESEIERDIEQEE